MPRILLAEDNVAFRYALGRYLSEHGIEVLTAADGSEALQIVRDRNGRIDGVVTDVRMPNMDGIDLAALLGIDYPDLPVVFLSANESDPPMPCLDKDAELDVLHSAIVRALSGDFPGLTAGTPDGAPQPHG